MSPRLSPMLAESFLRSGKVRDLYRLGDGRLLLVASDRLSRVRRRPADADPGQGPGPHRAVAVLVRRDGRIVPNHLVATDPRPARTSPRWRAGRSRARRPARRRAARPDDALPPRPRSCRSRSSSAATSRARGWKDYEQTGAVCGIAAAAGPARERSAARSRSSRPSTKAEIGAHDENITFEDMVEPARRRSGRDRRSPAGSATSRSRLYGYGAAVARAAGHHPGRHEVRVRARPGDERSHPHRRGPDPGLVAVLGRRDLRARPGRRRASTSSSCATGSRPRPGTRRPPGRSCRPTSSTGTRARYVEAFERITGASFARYLAGGRHRPMTDQPASGSRSTSAQAGHPRPAGPGGRGQPRPPRRSRACPRVRVGRRVELTVEAADEAAARADRRAARRRAAVEPAHRGVRDRARSARVVAGAPAGEA